MASITFFNAGDYADPKYRATACGDAYTQEGEPRTKANEVARVKNTFPNWDPKYTMAAISENFYKSKTPGDYYLGGACGECYEIEIICGTNAHEWGDYGKPNNGKKFKLKIGDVCPATDPSSGYNNIICLKDKGPQKNSKGVILHFDLERSTLPADFPKDSIHLLPTGEGLVKVRKCKDCSCA